MKRIAYIRQGLDDIPGCLTSFPPEAVFRGDDPGAPVTQVWDPNAEAPQLSEGTLDLILDDDEAAEGTDWDNIPDLEPVFEIGAEVDDTFTALGGELGEEIRQSVLHHGTDALGYYLSFHITGVQWGIYIPVTGIAYLLNNAFKGLQIPLATKAGLAFKAILSHELFHFATDYAVAQSELTFREPWWLQALNARNTPRYNVIEEKLANAYMLNAFRSTKSAFRAHGKQAALRTFTKKQPLGYSDGWKVRRNDWERELEALAHSYGQHGRNGRLHPALWSRASGYDWVHSFPITPRIDWRYCPIHIVNDSHRLGLPPDWLSILSRLQTIQETPKFMTRLAKMGPQVQKAWDRTKGRLQTHITTGADFKKWPSTGQDVYSVRVNDGVRAHLKGTPSQPIWTALDIGNHKEMGHGYPSLMATCRGFSIHSHQSCA